MKQEYIQLLNNKHRYFGLTKGFDYLDYLLDNLKKKKGEALNDFQIYDYRENSYFSLSLKNEDINKLVQEIYCDFFNENQIKNSEDYKKIYGFITSQFPSSDCKFTNLCSWMLQMMFLVLKKKIFISSVFENSFNKKEYLNQIVKLLNQFQVDNNELNTSFTSYVFDVFVQQGIFKEHYFGVTFELVNKNFFCNLRYWQYNMVDVYGETDYKYSTEYLFQTLDDVMLNYLSKINYIPYNNLLNIVSKKNESLLNQTESFIMDFSIIDLYTDEIKFLADNSQALAFLDRIHLNKCILNEYFFNVLGVSCFKNYYFSTLRSSNILFQKNNYNFDLNLLPSS